jgi:FAD synthase
LRRRIIKMEMSEEKNMVCAILASEDRIEKLATDGLSYMVTAFPEQHVEGPTAITARDIFRLRNLTYEEIVRPEYTKAFKQVLENPVGSVRIDNNDRAAEVVLKVLIDAAIEKIDQRYLGEEYSREWKVIEGPKKGTFRKAPTKILAIGIYC